MKKAMVDIWEAGLTTKHGGPLSIHLTVHDELDFSVPRTKEGFDAYFKAKHLMENVADLRIPIIADGELGSSWGSLEDEKTFFKNNKKFLTSSTS